MGAFGERPYENDSAADWYAHALRETCNEVERLLQLPVSAARYDEYRAAAWLLTKLGRAWVWDANFRESHLSKLHDRLQTIKNDVGYIATWKSPTDFVKDLDDLIIQLQRVCKWNNVVVTF